MSSLDDESLGTWAPPAGSPQTGGETPLPDASSAPASGPNPPRKRIRGKVLAGVTIVVAAAVIASAFISLPYYALTPGSAQNVSPFIVVPASISHDHAGSIDLVDVEVTPIKAIDWLWFKLESHASILSSDEVQGPETNAQYNTEGVLDMQDAQQAAEVVAFKELGYDVTVKADGVLLYALDPGSPADAHLVVGDVITSIGSTMITTEAQLTSALSGRAPGQSITIGYRSYPSGSPAEATLALGVWRVQGTGANAQLDCVATNVSSPYPIAKLVEINGDTYLGDKAHPGHATACLGVIDPEPSYVIGKLPFAVNLNSEGIVGPSAGLAFTLGLMQKLDADNLTNGMQVAATGTMSVAGAVGAIGGIEQKTISVRSAGASIFLVPAANYKTAEQYAGTTLKVFAVSTISQALAVLKRYGGKIAPLAHR